MHGSVASGWFSLEPNSYSIIIGPVQGSFSESSRVSFCPERRRGVLATITIGLPPSPRLMPIRWYCRSGATLSNWKEPSGSVRTVAMAGNFGINSNASAKAASHR